MCQVSWQIIKVSTTFCEKVPKAQKKKSKKRNLASKFKPMTIVVINKYFKTIIYTK